MAMVSREYWTVALSVIDDDGAVSRMSVNCYEPGLEVGYPVIALWAAAFVGEVQNLTDGAVLGYTITKDFYEDVPNNRIADAGSDVEDKGVFLLETEQANKGSLSVPSILESMLVDTGALTGIQIDITEPAVAAFITLITEDIDTTPLGLAGEVHAVDSRGEEYVRVYDAYKQNRASFKSRGGRG